MCSFIESVTVDHWISDADSNMKIVESNLDKIPEIGTIPSHSLKNGQLVRFRGMIQDMGDRLLYLDRYEVVNKENGDKEIRCGKYKDILVVKDDEVVNEDSPNLQYAERRSLYCVSVPGLNSWANPINLKENCKYSHTVSMDVCKDTVIQSKRTAEDMDLDDENYANNSDMNKKQQKEKNGNDKPVDLLLNHPIDADTNYSCLINVYEELDVKLIKVNTVVDAIGFVSFESTSEDFNYLPATLVPRLHAVSIKPITHSNPFHSSIINPRDILSKAVQIRSNIVSLLTKLFLGDSLAAEYILFNLISRVYHRGDLLSLGHFSVNVTKVPSQSNYPEEAYNVLKNLIPKSHYIPMALDKMNSSKFLPEKDYENNCLKTGILQLSDHTHLFIDETKMEPGQLNSNGVANLKALNELITDQKLDYDFKYFKSEFPADIPVIVMSEGKSMLSTSVQVILTPVVECGFQGSPEELVMAVKEFLKEPLLTEVRQYLAVISHSEFHLADDLIETIQKDYVKLRQEERKANESDLHLLLILSRLISLSYGQLTLSKEMWDKAFEMEQTRKGRILNHEP